MILAIDCGSTNHKVALYDERLQRLAACSMPVAYTIRESDRTEFDPEKIWQDTLALIRQVCTMAKTTPIQIEIIALSSQAQTFTILDSSGRPLMPFISWMDRRSEAESAELIHRLGNGFHRHCSFPAPMPQLQLSKLLWISRNNPDLLKNTARIVSLPGFLSLRFAGLDYLDVNLAAMSGLYSLALDDWWPAALDAVGLRREQLGGLVKAGDAIPTRCACRDMNFSPQLKIVFAGNDQTVGAYANAIRSGEAPRGNLPAMLRIALQAGPRGSLLRRSNASGCEGWIFAEPCDLSAEAIRAKGEAQNAILPCGSLLRRSSSGYGRPRATGLSLADPSRLSGRLAKKGQLVLTLGTALVVYRYAGEKRGPYHPDSCWGPYPGGGYYELTTRDEGCAALDWAVNKLLPGHEADFMRAAESASPGAAYFYPQRMHSEAPRGKPRGIFAEPCEAKGAIPPCGKPQGFLAKKGESAWIGPGDLAARSRAVLEGICFSTRQLIEDDLKVGIGGNPIIAIGGGSQNRFWLQIAADILNCPVRRGEGDILLGAAMMTRPGVTAPIRQTETVVTPNPCAAEAYERIYHSWQTQSK